MKDILNYGLDQIKTGYVYREDLEDYECLICGKTYSRGQVYPIEGLYFEAYKAMEDHILRDHGSVLDHLLRADKKLTGLTDRQKQLMKDFAMGLSDKEIALKNDLAPATIRHQRFTFREKAKQAKGFLAIYEGVEAAAKRPRKTSLVAPHPGAKMIDERYVMTWEENDQIIKTYFSSLDPLQLKSLPSKEKRKIAVLRKIAESFQEGVTYTEGEVNDVLKSIFSDIATIRRYLIQYGFLDRTKDCSRYWTK